MATIIKAGQRVPKELSKQPTTLDFDDFTQQARACLEQARDEASQVLQQARDQAEAIFKEARRNGHEAGLARAESESGARLAEQLKEPLAALNMAADQIVGARQDWLSHWREAAMHVATAIAARVVRRQAIADPHITLDLVAEALQLAGGSAEITLRMHPEDIERLGAEVQQLIENMHRLAPTSVVADAAIESGGCRVDTRFGAIDQQFSAQLDRIEQELQ